MSIYNTQQPRIFSSQNELISFLEKRAAVMEWKEVDMNTSDLIAVNVTPFDMDDDFYARFGEEADKTAIAAMTESHNVAIQIGDKLEVVHANAFGGLLDRLGENSRMNQFLLAADNKNSAAEEAIVDDMVESDNYVLDTLNANKRVSKGRFAQKSTALYMDGQFIAFHSEKYVPLEQVDIFREVHNSFAEDDIMLIKGSYDLNNTWGAYSLMGLKDEVQDLYQLDKNVTPFLLVETSDTGKKSVTLSPVVGYNPPGSTTYYMMGTDYSRNLIHLGEASVEDVKALIEDVYAKARTSFAEIAAAQSTLLEEPEAVLSEIIDQLDSYLTTLEKEGMKDGLEELLAGGELISAWDLLITVRSNVRSENEKKERIIEDTLFRMLVRTETNIAR